MLYDKLSGMTAYVAVAVGALAAACAPTLPTTKMEVAFYKSSVDGAKVYLTKEQARSKEVMDMLAKEAIAANDQFFADNPQDPRQEYWDTVKGLMRDHSAQFICTITPRCKTKSSLGRVVCGLDGYTGVLDTEYLQKTVQDGQIETAELIPNFNVPYDGKTVACGNYAHDNGGIRVIVGPANMQRTLDDLAGGPTIGGK